jgi:hypothetical protein
MNEFFPFICFFNKLFFLSLPYLFHAFEPYFNNSKYQFQFLIFFIPFLEKYFYTTRFLLATLLFFFKYRVFTLLIYHFSILCSRFYDLIFFFLH